jgi:hypothetical protein
MNDQPASPRKIDDAPFAWLHKAALWRIRNAFDESTFLDQSLAVYLTLCELASDAQSETFTTTRRKIAERSGVSIRRVSEILARFKSLILLDWKQNFLDGSKELAPSTYTLTRCTPSTTLGTPSTRLGREQFSENCTVVEQSPEESLEKSYSTKASKLSGLKKELADRIEKLLGNQWVNDAGKWVNRIKSETGKSERVIAEVESARKEGRINTTPAQYAEQTWKEFVPSPKPVSQMTTAEILAHAIR